MKYILNYVVIIIVLAISIGMLYIIFQNKIKNLESNLKKNDILDAQHYEYLQKLVNTAVYKFNSFDPTKVVQPIGTVICFAGINIPSDYMLCDGTKLLISEYSDLFKVIGQTFNQSDTDSTLYFNLPDLRGQFVRGIDNNKGIDTGRVFGSIQNWSTGIPKNKFTTDVKGNHTHNVGSAWNGSGNPNAKYGVTYQSDAGNYTTTAAGDHSHTITGGGDLETRPNNIALNYIIKK
jgi:microcystin-dependent protein